MNKIFSIVRIEMFFKAKLLILHLYGGRVIKDIFYTNQNCLIKGNVEQMRQIDYINDFYWYL